MTDNVAVNAAEATNHQLSRARLAYVVQLAVFALLALSGPAAYALSGNSFLAWGRLWGLPWSIPLGNVGPQDLSPLAERALVVGCVLLNIALLAALLRLAWVKTDRGAYTDSRDGTWKVGTLAGGALGLVALGSLGVFYTGGMAVVPALFGHPFLFGCAAALMLPSAMYYLLPWPWVSHTILALGACVATLWAMLAMVFARPLPF